MGKLTVALIVGIVGISVGMTIGALITIIQTPIPVGPVTRQPIYKVNHKAIQQAKEFTVLITHEGFSGGGRGTGIIIDPTHVLTCYHLIPASPDAEIWIYPYPGSNVVKAKVVFGDRRKDLAIFELEHVITLAHYPSFRDTHDGEPVTIIGNALGSMKWFVTYGIISGHEGIYLFTDGIVKHGNSGGPWINNNGDIVGISGFGLTEPNGCDSGISGSIGSVAVLEFLDSWKKPSPLDILFGLHKAPKQISVAGK